MAGKLHTHHLVESPVEARLARTASLLNATLESTADGLLVVDVNGKISRYNQRFLAMWRLAPELFRGGDDETALTVAAEQLEDPEAFTSGVRERYSDRESEGLDVLWLTDGRVFERYTKPQRLDGEIIGRVWSFRDVTERENVFRRTTFLSDASYLLGSLDVDAASRTRMATWSAALDGRADEIRATALRRARWVYPSCGDAGGRTGRGGPRGASQVRAAAWDRAGEGHARTGRSRPNRFEEGLCGRDGGGGPESVVAAQPAGGVGAVTPAAHGEVRRRARVGKQASTTHRAGGSRCGARETSREHRPWTRDVGG